MARRRKKKKNSNIANQMKSVFKIFFIFVFAIIIVFLLTKRHDVRNVSENSQKSVDKNEMNSFLSEKDLFNKNRKDNSKKNKEKNRKKSHKKYENENLNVEEDIVSETPMNQDYSFEESYDHIEVSDGDNKYLDSTNKSDEHSDATIIYPEVSDNSVEKKTKEKDLKNKKSEKALEDNSNRDKSKVLDNTKKDKELNDDNDKKTDNKSKSKDKSLETERKKSDNKKSKNKKSEGIISEGPVDIPNEVEVSKYGPIQE